MNRGIGVDDQISHLQVRAAVQVGLVLRDPN